MSNPPLDHDSESSTRTSLDYATPHTNRTGDEGGSGLAVLVGAVVGLVLTDACLIFYFKYSPVRSMDDALGKAILFCGLFPVLSVVGSVGGALMAMWGHRWFVRRK